MQTQTLDLTADMIDIRDIIARVEELEDVQSDYDADVFGRQWPEEERQELASLTAILNELKGYGGDEQWRGDWYPITLIADSYFTDYTRDLLDDCGMIPRDIPDYIEIDWQATARNIRVDYSSIDIDGVTYWYR